jgi:hypothetical protein
VGLPGAVEAGLLGEYIGDGPNDPLIENRQVPSRSKHNAIFAQRDPSYQAYRDARTSAMTAKAATKLNSTSVRL